MSRNARFILYANLQSIIHTETGLLFFFCDSILVNHQNSSTAKKIIRNVSFININYHLFCVIVMQKAHESARESKMDFWRYSDVFLGALL